MIILCKDIKSKQVKAIIADGLILFQKRV